MKKERLTYLMERYSRKESTPDELEELLQFIRNSDSYELFSSTLIELMELHPATADELASSTHLAENVLNLDKPEGEAGLYTPVQEHQRGRVVPLLRRWWPAAAIILVLSIGVYRWTNNKKTAPAPRVAVNPANIAPGKNGAILTLADGSQVVLDSLENGVIASQNGAQVVMKNGGMAYNPTGAAINNVAYNTLKTPKGRQFKVVLPDGTAVWLNAASSITYPTVFTGPERKIQVTGEAYFEVTKNKSMPFRVSINDHAEIEVLGTHFNVNAYENEKSINTTLLEGSIRIKAGQPSQPKLEAVLKPGQQAQIANINGQSEDAATANDGIKVINNADVDKVIAWKNGAFNFEGLTLEEVMRQLERWYDIRVQFKSSASNQLFWGKMGRNVRLSTVLDMFKKMGVKYEWDGSTLTIL